MKRLILIAVLAVTVHNTYSQSLERGNLLGFHIMTINLKPNVTMDQFTTFYISKVIPEYEKQLEGLKIYIVKGIRGEEANRIGMIWLFGSDKARDKYFNPDGTRTALGDSAADKLKDIRQQLDKIGMVTSKYTDWVVQ